MKFRIILQFYYLTSSREKFCKLPLKFGISFPNVSRKESPEIEDRSRGGGGCFD